MKFKARFPDYDTRLLPAAHTEQRAEVLLKVKRISIPTKYRVKGLTLVSLWKIYCV